MNRQNAVCVYKYIIYIIMYTYIFIHTQWNITLSEKEGNADMDESLRPYAKCTKPHTKGKVLCDFTDLIPRV